MGQQSASTTGITALSPGTGGGQCLQEEEGYKQQGFCQFYTKQLEGVTVSLSENLGMPWADTEHCLCADKAGTTPLWLNFEVNAIPY